jgi:hypothetical protein
MPESSTGLVGRLASRIERLAARFNDWANNQLFRNPQTGSRVLFQSLPPREQARIRRQWMGRTQQWTGPVQQPGEGGQRKKPDKTEA